jgi:hypothetical protein
MKTPSPIRLALVASLVLTASCGDGTGPARTYALHTVNGMPLPAPYISGSDLRVQEASLTLGSGGRVVSVVTLVCVSPLPPGTTCSDPDPVRTEGTYSEEDETVTYGENVYEASFSEDEAVIWFAAGGTTGSSPAVWVYRR